MNIRTRFGMRSFGRGVWLAVWSLVAVLSLWLPSCGKYIPANCRYLWRYEDGEACFACHQSRRIYLVPKQPCGTVQAEIIRDCEGCRMYLSTHCHVFCDVPICHCHVEFEAEVAGSEYTLTGFVFKGGQRILLSDEAFALLTAALWNGDCPTVRIGIHTATLSPTNFRDAYRTLTGT